jgi:mitogen-activated protein kinase 1/3
MSGSRKLYRKLPNDKWEVGPDYEIIRLISIKSNVSICEARNTLNNEKVSIKRVTRLFDDPANCTKLLREMIIMRRLDHPNIPKLKAILKPQDLHSFNELYIVMEYAPSDMFKVLRSHINLHADQAQVIIYNLLCAVRYLQSAKLVHSDINPKNILFYQDCSVKLCSFGNTISLSKSEMCQSNIDSTVNESSSHFNYEKSKSAEYYQAPEEIYSNLDYNISNNVLSIGCIISALCDMILRNALIHEKCDLFFSDSLTLLNSVGRQLEQEPRGGDLHQNRIISKSSFDVTDHEEDSELSREKYGYKTLSNLYPRIDAQLIYLMENMMQDDPRKRITIQKAISHPYFDSIRDPRKEARASINIGSAVDDIEALSIQQLRDFYVKKIQIFNN